MFGIYFTQEGGEWTEIPRGATVAYLVSARLWSARLAFVTQLRPQVVEYLWFEAKLVVLELVHGPIRVAPRREGTLGLFWRSVNYVEKDGSLGRGCPLVRCHRHATWMDTGPAC